MPPTSSLQAHADVKLLGMQVLPGSESLRNGTLADWETIRQNLCILGDCIGLDQPPEKALRDKNAWSTAVDCCLSVALDCCLSAIQAAISRSDTALLSSIGQTLAHVLRVTHGCLSRRPAWLRLPERPHDMQRGVEALVSLAQRPSASAPSFSEHVVLIGLSTAICMNEGLRLGEGLLVELHCVHLKVSPLPLQAFHACMWTYSGITDTHALHACMHGCMTV